MKPHRRQALVNDAAIASLQQQVARVVDRISPRRLPVLLVLPFRTSSQELHGLLELPAVAGCLASDIDTADLGPRVGMIQPDGEWRLPDVSARSVCFLGWSRMIRPRRLFEAMQHGMRAITAMDASGHWRTQGVPAWYLAYLQSRWSQFKVARQIDRSRSQVMRWPRARYEVAKKAVEGLRSLPAPEVEPGRIMLVTGSLGAGGAERQLLNTAIGLVREGHDATVMCLNCGFGALDFYLDQLHPHVPVYTFGELGESLVRAQDMRFDAALQRMRDPRLHEFIRTLPLMLQEPVMITTLAFLMLRPAVVHLWQDATNIIGGLAGLLAGVPRLILAGRNAAPHHFFYYQRYMPPMYQLLLEYPEVTLINNSHAGAASYAEWLQIPKSRIRVVHNGIDTSVFEKSADARRRNRENWGIAGDGPVVGGVLRFSPEKDPLLWLQTAACVHDQRPDCRFVLFGEGDLLAEVQAQVTLLGLDRVLLLPGITRDVAGALQAFDLLLLTSTQEGLPNVLIEAQLLGCPVVTTNAGGAGETLLDGETGFVVDERSPQALGQYCCRVLADQAWRLAASAKGPLHIEQHFGLARMLDDTCRLYGMAGETA
ncbi:MAG: glycosyltransferase [Gammaproteobacteria bacterium]|nr:glycosyltransferase [Gammaproteobacteria bacterium]